ncbi:MAG TPA: sialidase family protein, partial [Actinomycetes bacterium]|nr:sialidase family protein [Actinomycetes bacterium]
LAVGLVAVGLVGWLVLRGGGSPDPGRPVVGGDLHSLVVSPTDPNRVWVGGHQAAAASADGGVTWTQVPSLANADPMGWVIDPADPARQYVGGHPGFQVSSDGGQSFTLRNQGLPATDVHGLGRDPASGRLYAAVVGQGLVASDDQGASWATVNPGVQTMGPILVDPTDPKRLYVSDMRNLLGSTDGGRSWQRLAALPGAMSLAQAADGTLFAAADGTVRKSIDRGRTFSPLGALPVQVSAVTASPDGRRLYAAGLDGDRAVVVRSDDAGATWQQVTK